MQASLPALRERYREEAQTLFSAMDSPAAGVSALREHAEIVDRLLRVQWQKHLGESPDVCLIAVGGYGRAELYPRSDVDILILYEGENPPAGIEPFLSEAWDLGLDIGHSVRNVAECLHQADTDVTVATALLERRYLAGSRQAYTMLDQAWQSHFQAEHFVKAKLFEQQQRYRRFEDTAYNLEPNLKESPGGLRDGQMVLWLAKALKRGDSLGELVRRRLLTRQERIEYRAALDFLRFLRIKLHILAGRREDRLAFEWQTQLAAVLHLVAGPGLRPSEVLMRRYYQAARRIRLFNEILIDSLTSPKQAKPRPLPDSPFAVREERLDMAESNRLLSATDILLAYRLLYRDREYRGFTPNLRRAILRAVAERSAAEFLSPACASSLLEMLRAGHGVYHALRDMNELGVLGRLIPPWEPIVGQMQHDLFHVYTVDQHILMVLRNMRRFADPVHAHEYPLCSELMQTFPAREVLYLACLFHDIAKGRGGDHSELGREEALEFCRHLGMPEDDAELVGWLVQEHLQLSSTAQKRDITDPAVVREFAQRCGSEKRLVALYLLTVADVRGTSPKVWNAWKARLFEQLFRSARALLSQHTDRPSDFDLLADRLEEARRLLALQAIDPAIAEPLWRTLDSVYLQRHSADEIAWHARNLHWRVDSPSPVVATRLMPQGEGLQIMVYALDAPFIFLGLMKVLARLGLSVLEARIHTSKRGRALDTFTIVDPSPSGIAYRDLSALLEHELAAALSQPKELALPPLGRPSRQQKHFPIQPRIEISGQEDRAHYTLEIVAADRTGLLARIAQVLAEHGISIVTARVNTLGARAEDVFVIKGGRLEEESTRIAVETELAEALV